MRMNYLKLPTDYVVELKKKGVDGRRKAMAFTDYVDDAERGDHNSVRFYAKAWNIGVATSHRWIEDFKKEIDLFIAHWELRNHQHYSFAKKEVEHLEHLERNKRNTETSSHSDTSLKEVEHLEHLERNKALNINNNNISDERLFEDLFFIYAQNYKFPGKKSEALEAYLKIKDTATHEQFKKAIFFYLHDPKHNFNQEARLYNAKNFFKEGAYYTYIPKYINIKIDDEWISGVYDTDTFVFTSSAGDQSRLPDEVFKKKFAAGELEFIREVAA